MKANKSQYYKLDDPGIVGKQEKKSAAAFRYHTTKTGIIFKAYRNEQATKVKAPAAGKK